MRKFFASAALLISCTSLSLAQLVNPDLAPGLQAYQSYDGGQIDRVDLQTGNLVVKIPLISYPQRGDKLKLSFSLVWNGKPWITSHVTLEDTTTYFWVQNALGPGLHTPIEWNVVDDQDVWTGGYSYNPTNPQTGQEYGPFDITQWQTSDGSVHTGVQVSGGQSGEISIDGSGFFNGRNQSGSCSQYCYTIDSSGVAYYPQGEPGFTGTPASITLREDPNGNEITATDNTSGQITSLTDTMGRTIPALPSPGTASTSGNFAGCTGTLPTYSSQDWQVPGANGSTLTFRFCYARLPISLPPHCNVLTKATKTQTVLQSVVLPNNQTWTFAYESSTSGDPAGTNYGDLTQITFPTGGTLGYSYQLLNGYTGASCSMSVQTRTENANDDQGPHVTTYSGQYTDTATVTDQLSNQTVYTFSSLTSAELNSPPYEVTRKTYEGSESSGTLLKTVQTNYQYIAMSSNSTGGYGVGSGAFNVFPTSRTTTYNSSPATVESMSYCCSVPFVSGTVTSPASEATYGLLSDDKVYDYSTSGTGPLLRELKTTYYFQSNPSYLTANMINLPGNHTTLNGSGAPAASTTYTYDESSRITASGITTQHASLLLPVRGNLSTVQSAVSSSSTVQRHTNWYDTGVHYQDIDANGNTAATYTYSSTYVGALPTKISNAASQSTNYTYDFNLGLKASIQDPNLQTTSYSYDNNGRLVGVTYPDTYPGTSTHASTTYCYNDTAAECATGDLVSSVIVTTALTPSSSETNLVNVDGFGRQSETQQSDPAGVDYVDTAYDGMGRVQGVTNPYRTKSDTTYGETTYTYDALNRMQLRINPDFNKTTNPDSYQQWTDNGNTVTFSDENFNQWQRTYDALGRLTKVLEPSGTSQSPTLETDYSYDALGDLTGVNQKGTSTETPVARSFQYDELGRLTYSNNPESGPVCYGTVSGSTCQSNGYDGNGNLVYKTDAVGVLTTNSYDTLNRLTSETYSDGSPTKNYYYDQSGTNTIGRLTKETSTGGGATLSYHTLAVYDARGRLEQEEKCSISNCGSSGNAAQFFFGYSYDLAGHLIQSNAGLLASTPAQPYQQMELTYSYDRAGHLSEVSSSWNDTTTHPAILFLANGTGSTPAYSPFGTLANAQLSIFTLGGTAAIDLSRTYDKRGRRLTQTYSNSSGTLYSYSLGVQPNGKQGYDDAGNVVGYTDSLMGSWTMTYDSLNRLKTATAGSGAALGGASVPAGDVQAWTYDSFGNRLNQTANSGAPFPTEWANYTSGLNRISTSNTGPSTGEVTYNYDGRMLSDGDRNYLWEAQGWLCGVTLAPGTGATAYYQYVYDPEGNLIATTTRTSAGCDLNIAPWQNFVVDQYGNQITELDAAGNWKHTNVFANGELLATYSPTGVHFAMGDWQGSKRVQASAAGAIEDTCWNLPFNDGLGCSASSGTDATEHHYTGKEYDPFTGLDLFGARDFTKYSGRFISPDWSVKPEDIPYADLENPQSLNLYAYVRNNPLTNVDADGHYIPFQQQWPTTGWGSSGTLQMIASFTSSITGSMFADLAQQQSTITASARGTSVTYTYPDGSKIVLTGTHPFRDNNPGDLRSGHGSIGRDGGFAIYPTLDAGVNALGATLTGKYADSTIGDTMKAFAPAADGNDPVKYANTLATAVGVPVTTKISALTSAQLMTFQYNIAVAEGYNAAGNTARYIAPPQ